MEAIYDLQSELADSAVGLYCMADLRPADLGLESREPLNSLEEDIMDIPIRQRRVSVALERTHKQVDAMIAIGGMNQMATRLEERLKLLWAEFDSINKLLGRSNQLLSSLSFISSRFGSSCVNDPAWRVVCKWANRLDRENEKIMYSREVEGLISGGTMWRWMEGEKCCCPI